MATHPRLWRLPAKESDGAASQESPMPPSQGGWHWRVTFWTHPTRTAEEESVERPCSDASYPERRFGRACLDITEKADLNPLGIALSGQHGPQHEGNGGRGRDPGRIERDEPEHALAGPRKTPARSVIVYAGPNLAAKHVVGITRVDDDDRDQNCRAYK